jgi:hypothetical protein
LDIPFQLLIDVEFSDDVVMLISNDFFLFLNISWKIATVSGLWSEEILDFQISKLPKKSQIYIKLK